MHMNGQDIKQLSKPIGHHPQHAWLDIVELKENKTGREYDDADVVPQVVDSVCGIESDEEDL